MTNDELERAAYAAGDTDRAGLLARIDELQRALGEAVAEIESLREHHEQLSEHHRHLEAKVEQLMEGASYD